MRHRSLASRIAIIALVLAGCGGSDGPNRQAVSGRVTIDGQPLDDGEIAFLAGAGQAPIGAGKIADGAFAISREDGPVPGSYRVAITSARPTGRTIKEETDPSVTYAEMAETIPDRYNSRSELRAEVENGGANDFKYDLEGRRDPTKVKAGRPRR